MDVSSRLTKFREEKGFSKNKLAKACGVTQGFISQVELGNRLPTLDVLQRICQALGITIGQFFADEDQLKNAPPDIAQFAIDKKNQALIRMIQDMQAVGYSNDVIGEWITTLMNSLENIARRYQIDHDKPKGLFIVAENDLSPEETEAVNKFKNKLKDPGFKPPWKED